MYCGYSHWTSSLPTIVGLVNGHVPDPPQYVIIHQIGFLCVSLLQVICSYMITYSEWVLVQSYSSFVGGGYWWVKEWLKEIRYSPSVLSVQNIEIILQIVLL
jgi:hypothetical protein